MQAGTARAPRSAREQLAVEVVCRGARGGAAQLHHPLRRPGDGQPTAGAVAGAEPGLGLEPGVEVGGVLHQPGAGLGRPQLADQPGGVPGRAAGQRTLLEEHDVGPPELGQVVGDAAADDPAADDDHAGALGRAGGHDGSPLPEAAASSSDSRRLLPSS